MLEIRCPWICDLVVSIASLAAVVLPSVFWFSSIRSPWVVSIDPELYYNCRNHGINL